MPFTRYFIWFALPSLAAGACAMGLLYVFYRKHIPRELPPAPETELNSGAHAVVPSWSRAIVGVRAANVRDFR